MPAPLVVPLADGARQHSLTSYGPTAPPQMRVPDPELTGLAALAPEVLKAHACAINIVDDGCHWSITGSPDVSVTVSARALSLCQRVLAGSGSATDVFVTSDASREASLADSPFVNGDIDSIRFYAAAPLIGRAGLRLGALCMWSYETQPAGPEQRLQLAAIRDAVMSVLEARRRVREISSLAEEAREVLVIVPPMPAIARTSKIDPGRWSIDTVIDDRVVRTVFQPVVHLASGTITGFEALSRGPVGSTLESPMALLEAAKAAGRLGELDWLCRIHATQAAADAGLDPNLSWLINVEPAGLAIACPQHLVEGLTRARRELRVILEVVERNLEGHAIELLHATDQARRDSWGVALDDVGAQEGSLALLPLMRPDVVKLDMSLVRGIPRKDAANITAAVRAYAERTGAVILAEGIETQQQEHLARVFGATYGQGYRYGRPGLLPTSVPAPAHVIPLRQGLTPLDGQSPFTVLSAMTRPERAPKYSLLHISEHLEDQTALDSHGAVLLACFQNQRFLSPAKRQRYLDLSRSTVLTMVLAEGLQTDEQPRFHTGPIRSGSALAQEWVVIVIKPHYAAAFVARDCGDTGPDAQRRFDYIFTHDRDAVIAAARSYLQELDLTEAVPAVPAWRSR